MMNKLVMVVVFAGACSYAHVQSGEVAVIRTPEGVSPTPLQTGDWKIGGDDSATIYSTRSQEREERLEVQASDGLGIVLDTSIRFHIVATDVVALDKELGLDYYGVLVGPTLRSQARRVVGRFKPDEIYSSQRELIERQIREGVEAAIKGRHIELEAVLIRKVQLPDQIQAAITNKLEAEQAALKMKFVLAQQEAEDEQKLMQTKAEAERRRIEAEAQAGSARTAAEAEADATRIAAKAAADAKKLDGEATAAYQKLVAQFLTPAVLEMQKIQATAAFASSPQSKLVMLGGGGGGGAQPVLDLRTIDK